jgi:hypothetical protein
MTTLRLPLFLAPRLRGALAVALVVLALPAAGAVVSDAPGTPARAYLDLRAAAAKATSVDALLPYLSATYRRVVSNLPAAERVDWLQRFKRVPPSGVTIQAQALAGDRCALGVVTRDAAHVKWSGRVEMVRENGAWKLADETWRSEQR